MNQEQHLKSQALRPDAVATRARIVAAAERLFAGRGIDTVSLSQVNRAAGQRNRSAVQYHFGSREGLIHAIFDKHTPGIEQRRHALLDEIESEGRLDLRRLVEALVMPVVEKLDDPDGGVHFVRISAELVGHPRHPLLSIDAQRVNQAGNRLRRLVAQAAPPLPEPLRVACWLLVTVMLFHGIADWSRVASRLGAPSRERFAGYLIDSIVAVLRGPG